MPPIRRSPTGSPVTLLSGASFAGGPIGNVSFTQSPAPLDHVYTEAYTSETLIVSDNVVSIVAPGPYLVGLTGVCSAEQQEMRAECLVNGVRVCEYRCDLSGPDPKPRSGGVSTPLVLASGDEVTLGLVADGPNDDWFGFALAGENGTRLWVVRLFN